MRQRYVGMVIVFGVLCAGAMAQDQPAPSAASLESILQVDLLPPLEFILHPVQSGFSSYLTDRYTSDIELAFKKEPVYVGKDIRRHALILSSKPLEYIGLAFDLTDLKLYIDVNRNLDLTDDGPGIPAREFNPSFFGVSKAEIELTHRNISVPYTMDIYSMVQTVSMH